MMEQMFHSKMYRSALLAALAVGPCGGFALDVAAEKTQIDAQLNQNYKHLETLYKDIHAHPELAFQENQTAAKLAQEMRTLGFEVTEHVGKTGIVAIYHNGDGPTVLVRTELDALPMEEKTGLPYASQIAADGSFSEGFSTTELPAAIAIGKNQAGTIAGKLKGEMMAITPSGCRVE